MFHSRSEMRVDVKCNPAAAVVTGARVVLLLVLVVGARVAEAEVGDYTHEWAVSVDGGDHVAEELARRHDFDVAYKVSFPSARIQVQPSSVSLEKPHVPGNTPLFDDVYVLRHRRLARRSVDPSPEHHQRLINHPSVRWAEQQRVKRRVKRDFLTHDLPRSYDIAQLNDPKWSKMWYLNRGGGLDMNVQAAWAAGATGKGVVVTILDDGLEKDHPDLIKNYDPNASYDVNNHDQDPMPRYDLVDSNRHGTRCAGEVAADANNSICAVGVAYEASVGGVRMLDGDVTDAVEARSLALNPQHIDIYSASWGPDDDGKTVDGPGQLATRAFVEGIRNGRDGKGSIFIWASGNGGRDQDNCNCDGYTNSIWTLSISSATEKGQVPWYSEACSSTLATTYSSGSLGERQIITTDLHHSCTTSHTGTSASAPLAAGICALALQVNRDITWRDMQHIVVRTARPENLEAPDWQINGVGRHVSHRFGYGLLDSYAMVKLARNWTSVPAQRSCDVEAPHLDKLIPQKSYVSLELDVTDCPGVNFLEHVQAKVSLSADRRGDIEIYLASPAGTKSTLLAQRPHDSSHAGFHSWPFMTVHMWGERPLGKWVLEVHNNGHFFTTGSTLLEGWQLIFYGTRTNYDTWQARGARRNRGGGSGGGGVVGRRGGGGSSVPFPYRRNHPITPPSTTTTTTTTTSTTTTTTTSPTTSATTSTPWHPYSIHKYPQYSIPQQYPHNPPQGSLPAPMRPPNHRDSSHHKGKAGMKDWSITMYGTETEPGQEVPPLVGEQHHSQSDPAMHHVVDTTEGKTETRDPGTHMTGYPSLPSSAPHLATTPLPVPMEKVLPMGCLRSSAVGACLECKKDYYIFNGQCLMTCSPGHFAWDPRQEGVTGIPTCRPCHYSCYNCSGPQDYECTKCWGDAEMYSLSMGQSLCQPRSLLDSYRRQEGWYMALLGVVLGLVMLVLVLGVMVLRKSKGSPHVPSLPKTLTGLVKPASNGKISYSPMAQESSDTLTTSKPYYDLATDEEEED